MSSSPSDAALNDAALLGAAAGLRTASPVAALAASGRLGRGRVARLALLAAAGELVADKLPFVPARTSAPALGGRIASGAFVGTARGGGPQAAAVGAAFAVFAAFGGQHTRQWLGRRTGRADWQIAIAEDALALSLAAAGARRAGAI
jgi:uncharacterized membrane protein